MHIIDKLSSINNEDIVDELTHLLDYYQLRISKDGQRMFCNHDYEGEVTLDQLIETFLRADVIKKTYNVDNVSPSLHDRLACDDLWEKILRMFDKSDEQLRRASYLLQAFTLFNEIRPYANINHKNPQAIIHEWPLWQTNEREMLFSFKEDEYKSLFGDIEPCGMRYDDVAVMTATRTMIETVYRRQVENNISIMK